MRRSLVHKYFRYLLSQGVIRRAAHPGPGSGAAKARGFFDMICLRIGNSKRRNPMFKKSYLHFSIGAVSLLLIDLLLAMPAEAWNQTPRFTCRASALRINEPLGLIFEPEVANAPDDPGL
jgi:hypothetical protein